MGEVIIFITCVVFAVIVVNFLPLWAALLLAVLLGIAITVARRRVRPS